MSNQQMIEKVSEQIAVRSTECQRGVIGFREVDGIPSAGFALVAPDCIMFIQPLDPDRDIFLEVCHN